MLSKLSVIFALALAGIVLGAAPGDDLPEGPGKAVVVRMCSNCHEIERVTTTKNSKKQWSYVVDDMVSRGAEGSEEDANAVIAYLARNYGKPVNVNTATAKEIEDGLAFPAAQAELVVRYRTDKGAFKAYEDLQKIPGIDSKLLEEQKKNIQF